LQSPVVDARWQSKTLESKRFTLLLMRDMMFCEQVLKLILETKNFINI